ncbi:MAG TPA: hypothetical protein VEY67_05025 [Candidatus Dormibacteraeota bacterium]|nr:hypothetical protein [Candidatus Dormibacteraeota bacterium]
MTWSTAPSLPSGRPASITPATTLAAVLFAVIGFLLAIFAIAFVAAAGIAPAELAAHPVGEALLRATPLIAAAAVVHFGVAAGLLLGAPASRPLAVVVAILGAAVSVAEAIAILAGRDPMAAESLDPARAAQSGLQIVGLLAATYTVMVVLSLRAKAR